MGGRPAPAARSEGPSLQGRPLTVPAQAAEDLVALVCQVLVPSSLVRCGARQLDAHYRNASLHLLPRVAKALSECAPHLPAEEQAALVFGPLERLCGGWAHGLDNLPHTSQTDGSSDLRNFFGTAVCLFLGTVVRQVNLRDLGVQALVHSLRALALIDVFSQDSLEYRALYLSVAEAGAAKQGFAEAMFWTLAEFSLPVFEGVDAGRVAPWGRLSSVHFLLGVLASPALIDSEHFFPSVWPVVVACAAGRPNPRLDGRPALAARAHGLAAVCFAHAGTDGREVLVQEYLSHSIAFLEVSPDDAVARMLASAAGALGRDLALRRAREIAASGAGRQLEGWALAALGAAVARTGPSEAAAAACLFRALCSLAVHADPAALPEPFWSDCQLGSILQAREPLRDILARHLVAAFPEGPRELLLRRLLDDFPSAAAAFSGPSPAELRRPGLGAALGRRVLRALAGRALGATLLQSAL